MSAPGAFSAIASATEQYDTHLGMYVGPEALRPLPCAVLVHSGHDLLSTPVAVGIPTFDRSAVVLRGVFASEANRAYYDVRRGWAASVSVYAACEEFYRGVSGRLLKGILVAVDLVPAGADKRAKVTHLVDGAGMTPGQREAQRRLDEYLSNLANPRGVDLMARVEARGIAALEPLRSVVAPMYAELLGRPVSQARNTRVPVQAASPVLTRGVERSPCDAVYYGLRCEQPRGHRGYHFADGGFRKGIGAAAWDDRVAERAPRGGDAQPVRAEGG